MKKDIILQVTNLSKNFGNLKAVNNISFEVRRGELFAFLGTNGAGKSTTIKMLTTLLKQDGGTFLLNGKNEDAYVRSKIGVVFQENMLDKVLTVKENLLFIAGLFIHNKTELNKKYEELKTLLEFEEFENKQYRYLSGGQKRRIEIARALIGEPEILFLDEPTTGLDPENRIKVWDIIKKLQQEKNITVFLTTHYMEEADSADYVVIIEKGQIWAKGTPSELKTKYTHDKLSVIPKEEASFTTYLNKHKISYHKNNHTFEINALTYEKSISLLYDNMKNIVEFEHIKGSMDNVFLNAVRGDKK